MCENPGTAHAARVLLTAAKYKKTIIENEETSLFYGIHHILGDSAYPLRNLLMTPF